MLELKKVLEIVSEGTHETSNGVIGVDINAMLQDIEKELKEKYGE